MLYGFNDFVLDAQRYELRRAGEPCKVEPKAFDLLLYLIQHRDRAVTRDELFERVWPGEFISDAVLSHHVMVARRAVGDDGRAQQVIRTVHGRGYRFIAAVRDAADTLLISPPHADSSLQMDAAPEPPAACQNVLAGEQTLGTILCVILDHAPRLSEQLTFEALQRLRQTFFAISQDVIQQHEGTAQFYGADGMLAAFGARSDHAQRGLSAALDLRQRLRGAFANAEPVSTGHLSGETPNLAIWFQHQAEPDTILLSAATMRLVEEMASDAERDAIRVPGYTTLMAAYKLS